MTDIAVYSTAFQAENLSWDLTPTPDQALVLNGTLDVSLFTAAQHYPNGFIPSGTILGIKTSGGKLGPYLDSLSNGLQTAVGILRASIRVTPVYPGGGTAGLVGAAYMVAFGAVSVSKLPFTSGTAAAGGFIDANGQADLKNIYFAA